MQPRPCAEKQAAFDLWPNSFLRLRRSAEPPFPSALDGGGLAGGHDDHARARAQRAALQLAAHRHAALAGARHVRHWQAQRALQQAVRGAEGVDGLWGGGGRSWRAGAGPVQVGAWGGSGRGTAMRAHGLQLRLSNRRRTSCSGTRPPAPPARPPEPGWGRATRRPGAGLRAAWQGCRRWGPPRAATGCRPRGSRRCAGTAPAGPCGGAREEGREQKRASAAHHR